MESILKQLLAQNAYMIRRLGALEGLVVGGFGGGIDPVADPAPDGDGIWGRIGGGADLADFRIPIWWDPAPDQLGKLSKVQLTSRLEDIANLRTKLDKIEEVYRGALDGATR